MFPFCPKCKVSMKLRKIGHQGKTVDSRGYSRFWICPKCKVRFKVEAEVIRRRS